MFLHKFVFWFHNNLFPFCILSMCVNLLSKRVSFRYCDLGSNLSSIKSFCSFVVEHLICLHLRLLLLGEEILQSFCTVSQTSEHEPLPRSRGEPIRSPILFPEVVCFPWLLMNGEKCWLASLRFCGLGHSVSKLITVSCDCQLLQMAGVHLVLRVSMWPAPRWKWFSMAGRFLQGRLPDLLNRGLWFYGTECFECL